MRRLLIILAAVGACSGARAGDRCIEPYAPEIKVPANATKADMENLRADALAFIAASDLYQKCRLAKGDSDDRLASNQALKVKIATQINAALRAFKAAHPGV